MEGKVKKVWRDVWYVEGTEDHWSSDVHPLRCTRTYALLYDDNEVDIDEDDIRDYYGCTNITRNIIESLNDDLHNEKIEYDEDGDLIGELADYI